MNLSSFLSAQAKMSFTASKDYSPPLSLIDLGSQTKFIRNMWPAIIGENERGPSMNQLSFRKKQKLRAQGFKKHTWECIKSRTQFVLSFVISKKIRLTNCTETVIYPGQSMDIHHILEFVVILTIKNTNQNTYQKLRILDIFF